ncbi:MAG: flagellar protein FlaG, partial [Pseudomonadota bacterium]
VKPPALPPPRTPSAAGVPVAPEAEPKTPAMERVAPSTLEAAQAAFKALATSQSLEITSFHDEGTGRYVVRVADRDSGRVLIQTPPDDLLRFLASAPSLDPPPTLIDA